MTLLQFMDCHISFLFHQSFAYLGISTIVLGRLECIPSLVERLTSYRHVHPLSPSQFDLLHYPFIPTPSLLGFASVERGERSKVGHLVIQLLMDQNMYLSED